MDAHSVWPCDLARGVLTFPESLSNLVLGEERVLPFSLATCLTQVCQVAWGGRKAFFFIGVHCFRSLVLGSAWGVNKQRFPFTKSDLQFTITQQNSRVQG